MKGNITGKARKILPLMIAALFAVIVFAALPAADSGDGGAIGAPGDYDTGDIAVINDMILNNGLGWATADTNGSATAGDLTTWTGVTWVYDGTKERIFSLNLRGEGLTGTLTVSGLTALWYLDCSLNQLTGLELSGCPILEDIDCSSNFISDLDLSGMFLWSLNCSHNELTDLDLSKPASGPYILDCSYNYLDSLDISGLTMVNLNCSHNELTSIDLTGQTSLGELNCSNNEISALSLAGLSIFDLDCSNNKIAVLDVSVCTAMKYLYCYYNEIASLNLTGCNQLVELNCSYNKLTSLNLTSCVVPTTFTQLDCSHNLIRERSDVIGTTPATYVFAPQIITVAEVGLAAPVAGGVPGTINTLQFTGTIVSWSPALVSGTFGYSETYTANIRIDPKSDYTLEGVPDGFFTVATATSVTHTGTNTIRATFPATNPFPTVTVGAQNGIMNAQTSGSSVTFGVTTTHIANGSYTATVNGLTGIGVTVGGTVAISGGTGTLTLVGDNTTLTGTYTLTLKISVATSAQFTLVITGDPIYYLADLAFINNIIQSKGLGWTPADAVKGLSVPGDWVVTWSSATGLNRRIVGLTFDNEGIEGTLVLSGLTELARFDCFFNSGLTELNMTGMAKLKYLDCSYNGIAVLKISGCTALEDLDCSYNALTALNVSNMVHLENLKCVSNYIASLNVTGCTALVKVECYLNELTSFSVSNLTSLTHLDCSFNALTALNVTGCTALEFLSCEENLLTSLNVTSYSSLKTIICYYNKFTSLNVTVYTALEDLDCSYNRIASLTVAGMGSLKHLDCSNNGLTSLSLSGCTALVTLNCTDNYLVTTAGVPDESKVTGRTITWDGGSFMFYPQKTFLTFTYSPSFNLPELHLELYIEDVADIDVSVGVTGGSKPYTFSATGLPPGISISEDGVISGAPTALGHPAGTATVRVTDDYGVYREITISYGKTLEPLLTFVHSTAFNIPASRVGVAIAAIDVSGGAYGGTLPYTFTAAGLPDGLVISADGKISGTPTAIGPARTVTITVKDKDNTTRNITISCGQVYPPALIFTNSPALNIPATVTGTAISNINVAAAVSGGMPPYTFYAPGLPEGITIDLMTGVISGAPAKEYPAGTATITVYDGVGVSAYITISYGMSGPEIKGGNGDPGGGGGDGGGSNMMIIVAVIAAVAVGGAAAAYFFFLRPKP